ncbi:MAG: histidinol-phosphate transaminase [Deltaproteobacteria bacterium]|nr:histidinol-phosphate transaminase [Deltaproteobacteria bacterium]
MSRWVRQHIGQMKGYAPGFQPASGHVTKLNTNENPYAPSTAVLKALSSVDADALRKYPPPLADGFRDVAAQVHGVERANVIATNGGDELLRLVVTTFVEPGRPIGVLDPSYSLYPVLAELHGSPIVSVEMSSDWSIPRDFAERMNDAGASLVMVVNPHAPSGALTEIDALETLASRLNAVLLIDEAYVDFVDPEREHDLVPMIRRFDNVILLRSLSKGYSLAGLRFGYGLAPESLIEPMLTKTRDSYNVDSIAQRLATAALESRADARRSWSLVRAERERVRSGLQALDFDVPPSQSNFVLCTVPGGRQAAEALLSALEREEIFVRHFGAPRIADKLRITIGTPSQNDRLLLAIAQWHRGRSIDS